MEEREKEIAKRYRDSENVIMRDKLIIDEGDEEMAKGKIAQEMENDEVIKNFKESIEEKSAKKETGTKKPQPNKANGHVVVFGFGAGGANVAHIATREGFTTAAINTSPEDLAGINVDHTFILANSYGSGKERRRAKEKLKENGKEFINFVRANFSEQDTYIVVATGGGGSGSGMAPMAAKVLKNNFPSKNIFLYILLGSLKEDIKSQQNMAEIMEEIQIACEAGVNYLMFDNQRVTGCIDNVYATVNEEAVQSMKFISRQYFIANNRRNIDIADMHKLYLDYKRMIIVSGMFNKNVSGNCDYEQQIIDAVRSSTQLPPTGKVMAYGIFLNVEERLYQGEIDENFRTVIGAFGEPQETFVHLQTRQSNEGPDFTIALVGLNDCVDRYELINRRIDEYNQIQADTRTLSDVKKVTINNRADRFKLPIEEKSDPDRGDADLSAFDDFDI